MKLDLGNTTLASTGDAGTSAPSYTMDLLAAPFRGIEGLAHGVYNLADWVTFDMLPNWDEGRVFGRSETTPGMLLEGFVQFAVPFAAIGKGLGVAGQAARASKSTGLLGKGAKALTKPRHKVKSRGKFLDALWDPRLNWKGTLATEMATDFVAFDGQEQRLSNLIQQFPALQNPVTQFLAADPDDNEAYGRAKNVLEGMLIGAGLTALFTPVMAGLRAIKKRRTELEAGASDEDAIISATVEHADAMKEARVFMDDASRLERRESADEWDDVYRAADGDPEDFVEMDLANTDWDKLEDATAMSREELEAIEAGGRVIDEVETDTAVIKKYKFENGSTQTITIDKIDPSIIAKFPKQAKAPEGFIGNVDEFDGVKGNWGKLATIGHDRPSRSFDPKSAFRYVEDTKTVHWWEAPTTQQKQLVREEMEARGYKVDRQRVLDAGDEAQWNEMHGIKPEGAASPAQDLIEQANRKRRAEKTIAESGDVVESYVKRIEDHFGIGKEFTIKDDETGELITRIKNTEDTPWMDEKLKLSDWPHRGSQLEKQDEAFWRKELGFTDDDFYAVTKAQDDINEAKFRGGQFPQILSKEDYIKLADEVGFYRIRDVYSNFEEGLGKWKKTFKKAGISDDVIKQVEESRGQWEFSGSPAGIAELSMRNIEGQPVHSIMQRIEEGKSTVSDIVSDLEKTFPNSPFLPLMRKLKTAVGGDSAIKGMDELERLERDPNLLTSIKEVNEEGRSFAILRPDGKVEVGINKNSETPIEHILHESVHAATMQKIQTHLKKHGLLDIEFTDVAGRAKAIDALLKDKKVPKAVKEYSKIIKFLDGIADEVSAKSGLVDVDYWRDPLELITLGLSNRQFGNALKGIKYKGDQTLWQSLLDTIKSLLGIRPTHKANTAFDALVKAGDDLFALKGQKPRMRRPDAAFDAAASQKVKKTIENVDAKLKTGGEQAIRQTGSGMAKSGPTIEGGLRQDEMYEVIRQTGKRLNEEGLKPEKSGEKASAEEVGRQLARYTGADGKTIDGMIAAAKDNPQKLAEIETNMNALRSLMAANAEDIVELAQRFSSQKGKIGAEELEILEAEIKNAVEMQFNLQASVSQIASGFGRGLRATRYKARRIGLSTAELANEKLRQEYLRKRGSMSTEDVVNKIILDREKGETIWDTLEGINESIRGMEGGKFMSMLRESYIGSLLFGPRTSVINIMGNSIAGNIKQFERYVGGWLSAEPAVRKGVIDSMSYSIFSKQLWQFVSNVWRNGDSLLDAGGSSFKGDRGNERVVGAITGENFAQSIDALRGTQGALEGADTFKAAIDYVGKFFRLPMKVLVSTDEMYKQLEFRRRATAQLTHKAMTDLGMTDSKQISEYVLNTMEALVTSTGRAFSEASLVKEVQGIADNMKFESAVEREMFMADKVEQLRNEKLDFARQQGLVDSDNNINALEQLANEWVAPNLEAARVATFTNELGPKSSKVAEVVESVPFAWMVLPFIKAPTNILKFGFGRLGAPIVAAGEAALSKPFPGLMNARDSYLKALKSPDPLKRAEARGKLATGVVAWSALYTAISNTDNITGGGPLDPRQQKAWRAAGFMPYSIKINDKWISYQRLDPVATIVGTIADLVSVQDDYQHGFDKATWERAVSAGMVSLSRNLTNKSYLSGINNFLQAIIEPEVKAPSAFGRTMAGFIPNFLSQGQSITGDQTIKEARTIMDYALKKIPGFADRVDLRRNVLGEAAKVDMFETTPFQVLNPFNPLAWSSKANDPVLLEMANLHHGFSQPSHMLNRLVNLTEYTQSNGRTAYDRWLELTSEVSVRNNTLRQALEKLIKSNKYQRLAPDSAPGLPSPRVALLNRVISQYRKEALDQLFEEFPDIKYQYDQTVIAKQSLRQGGSFQDVLQLLNQ